ncbi:MAG: MBL fold metallo-hydrolase [Treponemataceae bacterium]|nr:MAG: MBL fold metallo-hydrolase [Treponemataceae bacterium]
MEKQVWLRALGGSGENGRNCFAVEYGDGVFLLDCGVKREIRDGQTGFYPELTRDFVSRVSAVFISHCHEDHTAALPLLFALGYRGKVYASAETAAMTPSFIAKWTDFVKQNRGSLPFSSEDAKNIRIEKLPSGGAVEGIPFITGRSGHAPGGIWFHFDFEGRRVFYSGDMTLEPLLLAADMPPACDAAILNCAHAGMRLNSREQYAALERTVGAALSAGGMVLLPVPPAGRGSDLYWYLSGRLRDAPLFVDQNILTAYDELIAGTEWVKQGLPVSRRTEARVVPVNTRAQREEAWRGGCGVYLAGDGMLSTADSRFCYEQIKGRRDSKIIITGHAAAGTIAAEVQDKSFRDRNGVACGVEKIILKAHLDEGDAAAVQGYLVAKQIVLFHAARDKCDSAVKLLEKTGATVRCIAPSDRILAA